MEDDEVVEEVLQCLRGMFPLPDEREGRAEGMDAGGHQDNPGEGAEAARPVATKVTRWHTDPFSCGSYSYMAVGSRVADRVELGRPEHGGALLFAGEATSVADHQCVTGAFKSGRRAARAALRSLGVSTG